MFCFQINRTLKSEKGNNLPGKTQKELKKQITKAGLCQSDHQLALGEGGQLYESLRDVLEKISIQNNVPIEKNLQIYYTLKAADVLLANKDVIGCVATIQWWRPTSGAETNWTLSAPRLWILAPTEAEIQQAATLLAATSDSANDEKVKPNHRASRAKDLQKRQSTMISKFPDIVLNGLAGESFYNMLGLGDSSELISLAKHWEVTVDRDRGSIEGMPGALQVACTKASRLMSCLQAILGIDVLNPAHYRIWREVCNVPQHELLEQDEWARELLAVAREDPTFTQLEQERVQKAGSELAGGEEINETLQKAAQLTGKALTKESELSWTMNTAKQLPALREKFRMATVDTIEKHLFNALIEYAQVCEKEEVCDPAKLQSLSSILGLFVKDGNALMYQAQLAVGTLQSKVIAVKLEESTAFLAQLGQTLQAGCANSGEKIRVLVNPKQWSHWQP